MKKAVIASMIGIILFGALLAPNGNSVFAQMPIAPVVSTIANVAASKADTTPNCGFGLLGDSSIAGCVAEVINVLIYYPSFLILTVTAYLFDWSIDYTIKDTTYKNGFVEEGWGIVRDISNIFFIFVLLWIAVGMMLGLHSVHPGKDIATVIIIALVINFSLFITRVVVDSGNILSYVFYNNVAVMDKSNPNKEIKSDVTDSKALSQSIAGTLKLANILTDNNIHSGVEIPCRPEQDPQCPSSGKKEISGSSYAGYFIFIALVMAVINLVLAWTFFIMTFLFIGRVVSIWLAMIFAPFAFVSYTLPALGKLPTIGHKAWWSDLLGAVFFAPIFMFFLFLIIKFLGIGLQNVFQTTAGGIFPLIMSTVIPFLIVIGLILKAKSFSLKMAGETASMFVNVGMAAGGLALGAATGGAALGAQRLIGASAASKLKDEGLKDAAAGKITNEFRNRSAYKGLSDSQIQQKAERTLKTAQARSQSSFDFRQTALGQQFSSATGMNMGSFGRLATGNLAGGVEGAAARKAEKDRKFAELLGENSDRKAALEGNIKARKKDISDKEDAVEKAQNAVNLAKASGGSGAGVVAAETALAAAKEKLREAKKGDGSKIAVGAIKADGTQATAEDVANDAKTIKGMSLEDMEKALENNKKGRAKEYYHRQMINSGYAWKTDTTTGHVHKESRDDIGNIKDFGHLDTGVRAGAREWGRDLLNSMKSGALRAGGSAALIGAFAGPMGVLIGGVGGALVGSIKGAVSGGVLPGVQEIISRSEAWATRNNLQIGPLQVKLQSDLAGTKILADAAHIASDESHKIHVFTSKYKSPSKGFFQMFEGLSKVPSGGGGGGHDDHGGGDHGGGHH